MFNYILVTESALDAALVSSSFSEDSILPTEGQGICRVEVSDTIVGYRVAIEAEKPYFALIRTDCMKDLMDEGGNLSDAYRRIARVVKGLRSPPISLPRQWSEYHYKNLLAFFALPRDVSNVRWIVDLNGDTRCARFENISSPGSEIDLKAHNPTSWPSGIGEAFGTILTATIPQDAIEQSTSLAQQVDLQAIGSASVVGGRTYDMWLSHLSADQRKVLETPINESLRIVGPAGSGKTLALCMRAIQISRESGIIFEGKRILVATHSWAMSERIDGVLSALNGGTAPSGITVYPLLSLLEEHAGHVGQQKTEIIGDDSSDGRQKSLEIISSILKRKDFGKLSLVSAWIGKALEASPDSRDRLDLTINLYEELSGVLTASGVALDDIESVQKYIESKREDWMPPFASEADRTFVISVYRSFCQELVDRGAITTDQFIVDSIRILETFAWRMRKETDGYDFIFVDELQLFDPQERSALELLGRSRKGVPFITAEDPSQGVFSALNTRKATVDNVQVYLETVHRFNPGIFRLINFIYQKFPLNALSLKIEHEGEQIGYRPDIINVSDVAEAISKSASTVKMKLRTMKPEERICIVTLGDVDKEIVETLTGSRLSVVKLASFDDIEQLAYRKKSIVVSPWQFIGGTQFAHVVVLAVRIDKPDSQFGRLREMTSVYLSCSRAAETLTIICSSYIPEVIGDALQQGLIAGIAEEHGHS